MYATFTIERLNTVDKPTTFENCQVLTNDGFLTVQSKDADGNQRTEFIPAYQIISAVGVSKS